MARIPSKKADIEALQRLVITLDGVVDYRPIIAYVMHYTSCTYREIAEVFGISKQMAETLVKQSKGEK